MFYAGFMLNELSIVSSLSMKSIQRLLTGFENKSGKYNADIKYYKTNPKLELKEEIQVRFEELCRTKTCYESHKSGTQSEQGKNQHELLRVLKKPWIPLHTQ